MKSYTKPQLLLMSENVLEQINAESGGEIEPTPTPKPTSVPASTLTPATYVCPNHNPILAYSKHFCKGCTYPVDGPFGKACPFGLTSKL